jgi:hypothetical protein
MAIQKKSLKESDVSTEIDLKEVLGPIAKDQAVRETLFQVLFDQMIDRLSTGRGVDNKIMPKYSDAYKNSLAYKAFGKDGTVNLELTGDMINSVNIQKQNSSKMTIGFTGDVENAKAFAHMTGFEGHPTLDGKVKRRNFFGWTDKEIEAAAEELRPSINEDQVLSDNQILALLDRLNNG